MNLNESTIIIVEMQENSLTQVVLPRFYEVLCIAIYAQ